MVPVQAVFREAGLNEPAGAADAARVLTESGDLDL